MSPHFSRLIAVVLLAIGVWNRTWEPANSQLLCADIVSISASDSGFYNEVGRHSKLDGSPDFGGATPATFNYSTGTIDEVSPFSGVDVFRKNYFTFDLTGYSPGSITGGSLELFLPFDGYSGPSALTYSLFGSMVPGPPGMSLLASELTAVHSPFVPEELAKAKGLFAKIADMHAASFPPLGTVVVTEADEDSMIEIALTPFGVSYLNAFAGGKVVLGGFLEGLTTVGPPDDSPVYLFGFTSPVIDGVVSWDLSSISPTPTPVLKISTIPEPSTAVVVCLTLGVGLTYRRPRILGNISS